MNEYQLAHASFSISADTLHPGFWTRYFGIEPDTSIIKGETFINSAGRPSRFPGRVCLWGLESRNAVKSDTLEPHLRYLIARLNLPRAGLRQLLERKNAEMRFFCYWDNYAGNRVPDVPEDIRAMMHSMGGTIDIDEYR